MTTAQLLDSGNFALSILPTRLAHRIHALRSLPYIVVADPRVSLIHNNYVHSLSKILPFAQCRLQDADDEARFTAVLAELVETHANTISVLATGFRETKRYLEPAFVTGFLDTHLRARIGTRLIAEHHIALHTASRLTSDKVADDVCRPTDPRCVGVIDTALRPANIAQHCAATVGEICELHYGVRPSIAIDGDPGATIAHVPMHIEYIMTELLKNTFRATIESGHESRPIQITIAPAQDRAGMTIGSPSLNNSTAVTIRFRDHGGGIQREHMDRLWDYGFTTFDQNEQPRQRSEYDNSHGVFEVLSGSPTGGSSLAGLGYGLPLSRAYAEFFGGSIAIQNMSGYGCDVYLRVHGLKPVY